MGNIGGRVLFFVTSPRSPMKMIPEIRLLTEKFAGNKWNTQTQKDYMDVLFQDPTFLNVSKLLNGLSIFA